MKKLWNGKYKWIIRTGVSLCILGIIGLCSILGISGFVVWQAKKDIVKEPEKTEEKPDCILVLGAGLKNGKPSLVLKDRLDKAVELYKNGVSDRLLMSGDHGRKDYDEVKAMKEYAIAEGVPAEHIFMDHAGFSTYDSVYRAKAVFQATNIAIVTQPYHISRALYLANKLDVNAVGYPSKPTKYRNSWILEVREKLARTKDFFKGIIKPDPTYLGEPVPVSGLAKNED